MSIKSNAIIAAVGLGMSLASPTVAQMNENDLGGQIFQTLCATCHGATGHGDGPLTELLIDKLPDLTQLSANNDGVFPLLNVLHIVDGRTGLRGHGGPMPVYGHLFNDEATKTYGQYGAEAVVRGRILSLVYYLESIQE